MGSLTKRRFKHCIIQVRLQSVACASSSEQRVVVSLVELLKLPRGTDTSCVPSERSRCLLCGMDIVNFSRTASTTKNDNFFEAQNNSTFVDADPDEHELSLVSLTVIGVTLSLIIFCAIGGNILVCVAVYSDRHLRKTGNLFIVSLALADMLVATLVMPFALANDLLGYWAFNIGFCNIWVSFDVMGSTASILNLCAISVDRYVHIRNPMRYHVKMKLRTVLITVALLWTCSMIISFIPISLGWHELPFHQNVTTSRDEDKPLCALEINPTYAIVSSAISFYFPCIVMVSLYMRLYMYARKHVKNIKALSIPPTTSFNDEDRKTGDPPAQATNRIKDHKAAITVGIIMGAFLVCWSPFFCVNIVAALCVDCVPKALWLTLTWLGYCNSSLNPIIYSIFNTEFRNAFKRILGVENCGVCCRSEQVALNARVNSNLSETRRFLVANDVFKKEKSESDLFVTKIGEDVTTM